VRHRSGIVIRPHGISNTRPPLDTIFVLHRRRKVTAKTEQELVKWPKAASAKYETCAAVGRGILPGCEIRVARWPEGSGSLASPPMICAAIPKCLRSDPKALFTKTASSTAVLAALQQSMSLYFDRRRLWPQIALNVAQKLVVHVQHRVDTEQYSEADSSRVQSCRTLRHISTRILCNLNEDCLSETLAHAMHVTAQFSRLFKAAFGKAPADLSLLSNRLKRGDG